MTREQVAEAHSTQERGDDEKMRGGWARYQRQAVRVAFDFRQSAGQRIWIPSPMGSRVVSAVFSRARPRELDQHGRQWREEDHGNRRDAAAFASVFALAAHAAENHSPLGD